MSGCAGKMVDYPLDTIKVLLQTQNGAYRGAFQCAIETVRRYGIRGLYRGILTPMFGQGIEMASLFACFGWSRSMLGEGTRALSIFELCACGAFSGAVVSFVITPVELVKCRLQVQQLVGGPKVVYTSPLDVISRTIRSEGIRGMYRGLSCTLMREIPGNFAWFGTYETLISLMTPKDKTRHDLPPLAHMTAGAMSAVAYWTAFFPADVVKSKVQTDPALRKESFLKVMKLIFRTKGIRGLYAGWGVTCALTAPSHAIIFAVYESVMSMIR